VSIIKSKALENEPKKNFTEQNMQLQSTSECFNYCL